MSGLATCALIPYSLSVTRAQLLSWYTTCLDMAAQGKRDHSEVLDRLQDMIKHILNTRTRVSVMSVASPFVHGYDCLLALWTAFALRDQTFLREHQ